MYVIEGDGLWTPPPDVVDRAAGRRGRRGADGSTIHPGPLGEPAANLLLRRCCWLFLLAILPGLASPRRWFELRDAPSRIALIPGMSIVLTLLSGIAVLAVWRGPLTTTKAWVVVGGGHRRRRGAFRVGDAWLRRVARVVRRLLQQTVRRLLQPRRTRR